MHLKRHAHSPWICLHFGRQKRPKFDWAHALNLLWSHMNSRTFTIGKPIDMPHNAHDLRFLRHHALARVNKLTFYQIVQRTARRIRCLPDWRHNIYGSQLCLIWYFFPNSELPFEFISLVCSNIKSQMLTLWCAVEYVFGFVDDV